MQLQIDSRQMNSSSDKDANVLWCRESEIILKRVFFESNLLWSLTWRLSQYIRRRVLLRKSFKTRILFTLLTIFAIQISSAKHLNHNRIRLDVFCHEMINRSQDNCIIIAEYSLNNALDHLRDSLQTAEHYCKDQEFFNDTFK